MSKKILTSPVETAGWPKGIPYILGNEAAERFSFYGMKAILVIYMTKFLHGLDGGLDTMTDEEAKSYYHLFTASAYFFPVIGAIVSDWLFGKYRTIIGLSLVYCLGHLVLAMGDTGFAVDLGIPPRMCLFAGLTLIAMGSGGIKPCVSAHVGDQFGKQNHHYLSKVFGWFYFVINLGAFLSTLVTPVLLEVAGPSVAFGLPGLLMFLATIVFWLGRREFVHIPAGGTSFLKETFSKEGLLVLLRLSILYFFISIFWSLFDQTGSSWVLQAEKMDLRGIWGDWLASQIQALNPLLILLFIPLFDYVVYPAIHKVFPLTPLRKIAIGMFLMTVPFAICAYVQSLIDGGATPSILWHVLAYIVLTAAEVMVSITGLDFSYSQSPKRMKSIVMSFWLLSVSVGNFIAGGVNHFIANADGTSKLEGPAYFWFFSGLMFVASVGFVISTFFYSGKTYIQGDDKDTGEILKET
ncbi:MAG: POT family proton-dependent oligopeptide transporter [Pirellulaceae bacterium]|jgi:POT family proton-dependent oligopeptide transporter